jgi:amino acid transporter
MLSPPRSAPFASWVTGWFNLLGQVAVTTGIRLVFIYVLRAFRLRRRQFRRRRVYIDSVHVQHELCAEREDDNRDLRRRALRPRYRVSRFSHPVKADVALLIICAGLINTFGVHLLRYLNNVSIGWHAIGTTAVVIAILAAAPTHQNAKFVFQTFIDNTGIDGVGWSQRASPAYVVVVGGLKSFNMRSALMLGTWRLGFLLRSIA